jgi:hypothetical protein
VLNEANIAAIAMRKAINRTLAIKGLIPFIRRTMPHRCRQAVLILNRLTEGSAEI